MLNSRSKIWWRSLPSIFVVFLWVVSLQGNISTIIFLLLFLYLLIFFLLVLALYSSHSWCFLIVLKFIRVEIGNSLINIPGCHLVLNLFSFILCWSVVQPAFSFSSNSPALSKSLDFSWFLPTMQHCDYAVLGYPIYIFLQNALLSSASGIIVCLFYALIHQIFAFGLSGTICSAYINLFFGLTFLVSLLFASVLQIQWQSLSAFLSRSACPNSLLYRNSFLTFSFSPARFVCFSSLLLLESNSVCY